MLKLIAVSIIWAFSFGLIKGELTGLPPQWVASIRLLLCALAFLPFYWLVSTQKPKLKLLALGIVQFGLMYMFYIQSYQYLPGHLVAVFTLFTPLYVVLINSGISRSFILNNTVAVLVSIAGAAIIVVQGLDNLGYVIGFLLLQLANVSFAFGQVLYKRWAPDTEHGGNMFWMYVGAAVFSTIAAALSAEMPFADITQRQWLALAYLGLVSSGLCFYLWNSGSKQVSMTTLAIMNNGYVPFAVLFAGTLFNESIDWLRLLPGLSLMLLALWWVNRSRAC